MIDDQDLMLYLFEIEEQCRYASKAWKDAQSSDYDLQWYSIQAFLVAIANISKFLWPVKKASKETKGRCEQLRSRLSIEDDHPFKSRSMRDSFEHSDERLDEWIASPQRGMHYGRISSRGVRGQAVGDSHYSRYFELDSGVLTFFGEEYDLKQIAEEAEKLYETTRKAAKDIQNAPTFDRRRNSVLSVGPKGGRVPTLDSTKKSERVPSA
jgi:hypothetical protein